MLLVVAGVALLLPLGSTGWMGQALEWFIAVAMRAIMVLLFLFSLLMTLLLYPLRFLLKLGEAGPLQSSERPTLNIPTQAEVVNRLPDWLGGAVLWTTIDWWADTCMAST